MIWLSLLLSQDPPPDWTPVQREGQGQGESALATSLELGSGHPFSAPESQGQLALVAGEDLLASLQSMVDHPPASPDFEVHITLARTALELSEMIVQELTPCQSEVALQGPCRARAADALRLAAQAILAIPVPVGADPAERAYFNNMAGLMREIRGPLVVQAKDSYQRVANDPTVAPPWRAHARWALTQLPEQQ